MSEVLSHFLERLDSPRQCILLARFSVMLAINLGSGKPQSPDPQPRFPAIPAQPMPQTPDSKPPTPRPKPQPPTPQARGRRNAWPP